MSRDIVDLAISMTEIDTGIQLSLAEREAMVERMLARLKNINQHYIAGWCILNIRNNLRG